MTSIQLIESKLFEGRKNPSVLGYSDNPTRIRQSKNFASVLDNLDYSLATMRGRPMSSSKSRDYVRRTLLPTLLGMRGQALISKYHYRDLDMEYDRHIDQFARDIHRHVRRRAVKAGYLNADGTAGPNSNKYNTELRNFSGQQFAFDIGFHDSAQHAAVGALPTYAGEQAAAEFGQLMADVQSGIKISEPRAFNKTFLDMSSKALSDLYSMRRGKEPYSGKEIEDILAISRAIPTSAKRSRYRSKI